MLDRVEPAHTPSRRPARRWARAAGALGVVIATLLPDAASAAGITGKLENFRLLQNPVWAEAKDPKRSGYSFREIVPTVPAEFRRLFPHIPKEVCVAAISEQAQKPGEPILIRVGGGRTTPVTLVVVPGTKLIFRNTDPFKHRLYGVGIKTFAANETMKGGERAWTVPSAGVFEIRDELAPSLRMWIVGNPKVAAIAYPTMKGEFRLSVKQPGEYKVQAYFSGKQVGEDAPVTVDGGNVVIKAPIKVAKESKKSDKEKSEE